MRTPPVPGLRAVHGRFYFFLKKFYKKGSAFSFFVDLLYWEWKFARYGSLKKLVPLFHFLTDYHIGNENSEIR